MNYKSRVTGAVYTVADAFRDDTIKVAIFKKDEDWDKGRPIGIISYQELLDNFEKVEV